MANLEPISCRQCGKIFTPHHWSSTLCSDECRMIAKKNTADKANKKAREARKAQMKPKRCAICHRIFMTNRSDVVTCSPHCQHIRDLEKMRDYAKNQRIEKKQKPMSIDEFNRKAREMGMSYGQYELYLRMHGKEK